jgi:hypothetical protein
MSAKDLMATQVRFAVVVDVLARGRVNDVPTMAGWTREDLGGATTHPTISADAFTRQARQRYGTLADEFLKLYPAATDEQARASQNESAIDSLRASTHLWASTAKVSVFTWFWDHALPGPDADRYGAFHSSEIPYVMNTLDTADRPFTDADRKIADTMSSYWVNFISTGAQRQRACALAVNVGTAGPDDGGRRHVRADPGDRNQREVGVLCEGAGASALNSKRCRAASEHAAEFKKPFMAPAVADTLANQNRAHNRRGDHPDNPVIG